MIQIELPWPPSVNHYWRHVSRMVKRKRVTQVLISREGRIYRSLVGALCQRARVAGAMLEGDLVASIAAHPPDMRRRDLDNLTKSLFDSLAYARIYDDDCQISDYRIYRSTMAKKGHVLISIEQAKTDWRQVEQ